jgi:hypothetical protein
MGLNISRIMYTRLIDESRIRVNGEIRKVLSQQARGFLLVIHGVPSG